MQTLRKRIFGVNFNRPDEHRKVFQMYLAGWRLVIANCPLKVKKNRNEMTGWERGRFKNELLDKNGHRCECCGRHLEYKDAQLHHILPISMAPHLAKTKSNMMILCNCCHKAIHGNPFVYSQQILDHYPEVASQLQ